jgi:hypothetical protein
MELLESILAEMLDELVSELEDFVTENTKILEVFRVLERGGFSLLRRDVPLQLDATVAYLAEKGIVYEVAGYYRPKHELMQRAMAR